MKTLAAIALVLAALPAGAVTLEETWASAEAENLDLQLARERTRQVATLRWQAASSYLPQVSATFDQVWNQDELLITFPNDFLDPDAEAGATTTIPVQPRSVFQGNLTLIQPLIVPQAIPGMQAASRAWRAAQADEQRAEQLVRAGAARVFYGLLAARQSETVAEGAEALARQQRELARQQVEVGLADRRAVLQAELALARAGRDRLGAHEAVATAEQTWARVTGRPTTDVPEPPAALEVPASLEEALSGAVDRRPDVDAAALRWLAARQERTARDLEWAPTVGFAFSELLTTAPGFVPAPFQWRAMLRVQWNLFDGGLRIARSRELSSRAASAGLIAEQAEEVAHQDVVVAWERLLRTRGALASVEAEVALAEENRTLAEAAFTSGSASFLEVEAARLALDAARLGLVQGRADHDLAAIDLRLAMGTL